MPDSVHKIALPINKSAMIRHLAMSFIYRDFVELDNSWSNDIQVMHKAIQPAGVIDFEDAGTPMRIMCALLSSREGVELKANESLAYRPLKPLLTCLESLGAQFEYKEKEHSLPFKIIKRCSPFTECTIDGRLSSQFVSAMILLACMQRNEVEINYHLSGSSKYIAQTLDVISAWGIKVTQTANSIILSEQVGMSKPTVEIEADYSSLAFMLNLALAKPSQLFEVYGLNPESKQADKASIAIYRQIGMEFLWLNNGALQFSFKSKIPKEIHLNIKECIDLGLALIAACAFLNIKLNLNGYQKLAFKESNRIEAMRTNLSPLGIDLIEEGQTLRLSGQGIESDHISIQSFNDHRIVMAMAIFGLDGNLDCDNLDCVSKSYPKFWAEFDKIKN